MIVWLFGAVVEQVYSSTFKICLLKIQEFCPLKRFIFTSKYIGLNAPTCVWWPGSAQFRWGSLHHFRPPSWIKGEGKESGERSRKEEGGEEVEREGKKGIFIRIIDFIL